MIITSISRVSVTKFTKLSQNFPNFKHIPQVRLPSSLIMLSNNDSKVALLLLYLPSLWAS